jgi:hypothetical protein
MKRILFIILLSAICVKLLAPCEKVLYIEQKESINYYDPLIRALTWVESKHGKYIWNAEEQAVGHFQIRPIRVSDYNKRTNSNYKLEDFYDYELSRKMFLYYASGKSYEKAARNWNGKWSLTKEYWKKIQKIL